MSRKRPIGVSVLEAARHRIAWTFDNFERIYVSFSGGKDSTVMLHLVMAEAQRRDRKIGILFIDLEAQYTATIEHVIDMYDRYSTHAEPYWVALPIALRNAVSQFEPKWMCWDPDAKRRWVREPPSLAITTEDAFPFFKRGMEFEDFTPAFGHWFAADKTTACFVGIRSDESLNRYRTLAMDKITMDGKKWTTWLGAGLFNIYPIYDWRTEDIWTWQGKNPEHPYNHLYDLMHKAGLSIHQMRICQPYGDDQRKGLFLYHALEPNTWSRVVARVNGANTGALYAHETGDMMGRLRVSRPPGHTWQSYTRFLLASMPPKLCDHFEIKIAIFIDWWSRRGYPTGIPDEADAREEAAKDTPSWRRICKVIIKNDYWCKGLSFSQTKAESYERYLMVRRNRKRKWAI